MKERKKIRAICEPKFNIGPRLTLIRMNYSLKLCQFQRSKKTGIIKLTQWVEKIQLTAIMLVTCLLTDSSCWRQNHSVGDFSRYVGVFQWIQSVTNISNLSSTQTCHQDISSPTSVTDINLTAETSSLFETVKMLDLELVRSTEFAMLNTFGQL